MQDNNSPLKTAYGTTTIAKGAVAKVAGYIAQTVDGVMLGSTGRDSGLLSGVTGNAGNDPTRGVSVEVEETQAAVDLTMAVHYSVPLPQMTDTVRQAVVLGVGNLLGLYVTEVNITVTEVVFSKARQ